MSVISISIPKEQTRLLDRLSKLQKRGKSQIVREALDLMQFETRWSNLRKTGDMIAKRLNIESDDDVEQIAS